MVVRRPAHGREVRVRIDYMGVTSGVEQSEADESGRKGMSSLRYR